MKKLFFSFLWGDKKLVFGRNDCVCETGLSGIFGTDGTETAVLLRAERHEKRTGDLLLLGKQADNGEARMFVELVTFRNTAYQLGYDFCPCGNSFQMADGQKILFFRFLFIR